MSTPFDLHVLSTPPAFVLSQDQTLYKMVSTQVFRLELIFYRAICHSFIFIVTVPKNWLLRTWQLLGRFLRDFSQESVPSGAFFSLRCLIYKVHAASGGTLLLYMTSFRLSRTFFKVFWLFPVRRCTQQLFYCITLSSVCQEVFQLFLFARLSLISDNF